MPLRPLLLLLLLISACGQTPPAQAQIDAPFPGANRPVASIVSDHSGDEQSRDAQGEAETVMRLMGVAPGQTIADIGAGAGYFTVRLAPRVAPGGRVIATDVTPSYLRRLQRRVATEKLANVDFVLGQPDDPRLPPASVDAALLVRMYHEIAEPYAFMWRLQDALKPGGQVAIAERDRPIEHHGMPPALLRCEMEAVGYRQTAFHDLGAVGYLALFEPTSARPRPGAIVPC